MMEIKFIPNEDFLELATLCIEMYKAIDSNINAFQAINTLVHMINNEKGFIAIGLYDDKVLLGFVIGNEFKQSVFYFSGIYVVTKNTEWVRNLIEFSFDKVKELGYTGWEVDATNDNISSIMEKYGASVKYTRYCKEFE